jgi:N-glycosylase/DNA lyase
MNKLLKVLRKLKEKYENDAKNFLKKFRRNYSEEEIFLELCFCILVANSSMKKTYEIWKKIGKDFLILSKEELREKLKSFGYRFYNRRAEYIVEAREKINLLKEILKKKKEKLRDMLVKNFKGIGYKEASHFLRNLGYKDFAILDRHVLKTLEKYRLIEKIPKTLTKKKYLEIEEKLRKISKKLNISLVELDFYLFYLSSKNFPIK